MAKTKSCFLYFRNEITSSLSSSVQKKKRSANFDSDDSDDQIESKFPPKVQSKREEKTLNEKTF